MSLRRLFVRFFPKTFIKLLYIKTYGKLPNLKNPGSFYEKLMWLNFYKPSPLKKICADKFEVRKHLHSKGLHKHLNKIYGVFNSADEIDFDKLPESFVLKCTHGSGMNIFCSDKSRLNRKETLKKLRVWLKQNYADMYGELHYKNIIPRIICENYLGDYLLDFKVYCFHGVPKYIMICPGSGFETDEWYFYDFDWNYLAFMTYVPPNPHFDKPINLNEIYDFCKKLCSEFIFVRVDFYNINNNIIFGEMTFTPSAFMDNLTKSSLNNLMGQMMHLK